MWRALLSGTNLENVAITGENEGYAPGSLARFGDKQDQKTMMMTTTTTTMTTMFNGHNDADDASVSVIDGVGWKWWCKARSMPIPQDYCGAFNPHNETLPPDRFRPKLIEISESTNIVLDRFTARNSPVWFVHLFLTKNVVVTNLTVLAPREVGNTDGLDPDSCENVLIDSCYIDVGDDGVSIKVRTVLHRIASHGREAKQAGVPPEPRAHPSRNETRRYELRNNTPRKARGSMQSRTCTQYFKKALTHTHFHWFALISLCVSSPPCAIPSCRIVS
eukprot:jgi/Psemu1/265222/estExt_Genewise1Plus.C_50770002